MYRRVAILADLHLPDRADTIKEVVLDWAVEELPRQNVDLVLVAGDFTSIGTSRAAERFCAKLRSTGIPFMITLGNADRRTPFQTAALQEASYTEKETLGVLLLDTCRLRLAEGEAERLAQIMRDSYLLAVTHCPPSELPAEDRKILQDCLEDHRIALLVAGHVHQNAVLQEGVHTVCGMDPDKALGSPAGFTVFERTGQGIWRREEVPCPVCDPRRKNAFSCDSVRFFWERLGVALRRGEQLPGEMLCAMKNDVPALEIPWQGEQLPEPGCIDAWRAGHPGAVLSVSLPKLRQDTAGDEAFSRAVEYACRCRADMVVCDVPDYMTVEQMRLFRKRQEVLRRYAEMLRSLGRAGIEIGIRNAHVAPGEFNGEQRRYGCTPQECREWMNGLREMLAPQGKVGIVLDVGHARNNRKLATRYNLSEWYAEVGGYLSAIQLQQVEDLDDPASAHRPFAGWFAGQIPLGGLFLAWQRKQLKQVPLFLSVRTMSPVDAWQDFRKHEIP